MDKALSSKIFTSCVILSTLVFFAILCRSMAAIPVFHSKSIESDTWGSSVLSTKHIT
uniref:Uncharacterized protein n=1 Tax=Medicago truncatula TaxID=3880 RepID=I3T389_MEDTR|nr:unknown [Medicago truncatula]